mmetsp:Transcript_8547/g.13872  ORF Transcript_8547/g.13872 Transcript_8547/m.13872 type:complete len:97 (-) Transcript_8547:2262-2552(-)
MAFIQARIDQLMSLLSTRPCCARKHKVVPPRDKVLLRNSRILGLMPKFPTMHFLNKYAAAPQMCFVNNVGRKMGIDREEKVLDQTLRVLTDSRGCQ